MGQRECQGSSSSDSTLKPQAALPSPIDVFIDLAFALRDVWDAAEWHAELSRVHALTGKRIAVATPGGETLRGLCTGIDRTGRLLIDDNHAHHKIVAGSIVEM